MKIESYTLNIILSLITGGTFSALILWLSNRGKIKAETENVIGKTYGDLIDDLRAQVKYQGEQIKASQEREIQCLKIINGHQETERELRKQIAALEDKLSLRITKIEQENQ
ncbi:hypothetical protein [Pedobacter zeae]|uniref:Molybdopterin converting factor small subunit n=1 Tax=Pedobacter zeae TaxID=1737356 RepID=A0A7W6K9L8_9SPHI|nr:hypothetical protein [Pedobacter zeae]MBB4107756.1 molybdopterin converting factor small subunit [Pedobacter zeae]GGG97247.1 hypothetical protein GCM10007422_08980 [Pedobacter zeae]